MPPCPTRAPQAGQFPSTCWSLVLAARDPAEPRGRQALASLCEAYWYPLYAFIRRRGSPPELAEDLTQEFFAGFLREGFLDGLAPDRGRFRAFLLAACKNFLANRRDRDRALKRGGGARARPDRLPGRGGPLRPRAGPRDDAGAALRPPLGPDAAGPGRWPAWPRRWTGPARASCSPGWSRRCWGARDAAPYAVVAAELGLSEGAVKVAAHRLRRRYRELLRAEIGRTVDDPAGVDREIGELFAALARRERGGLL